MRNYQSIEMVESLVDTKKVGARMKESVRSRTDLTLACGYLEDALEFRSQDVRRDAKSMKIYRFFWSFEPQNPTRTPPDPKAIFD